MISKFQSCEELMLNRFVLFVLLVCLFVVNMTSVGRYCFLFRNVGGWCEGDNRHGEVLIRIESKHVQRGTIITLSNVELWQ
jgi:hypothetical protein